jgi:hypothetical protein
MTARSALFIVAALMLAACAKKAPLESTNPARGLRTLATEDSDVTAISLEAARAVWTQAGQPRFGGVFVNDRRSRSATDAVKRATGATEVTSTQRGQLRCRIVSSSGQEREVPCPPQAVASIPPTFTFVEVRATADSAYVGVLEADGRSEKASCVTLTRRPGGWNYLRTTVIANAKHCGR